MLNAIQTLVQTIAPLVDSLAADFGAACTVLVATPVSGAGAHVTYTYTEGSLVHCFVLDPGEVARRKMYGLAEQSTAMLILPNFVGSIKAFDGFRIESGPYQGETFVADTAGVKGIGVSVNVPVHEQAVVVV